MTGDHASSFVEITYLIFSGKYVLFVYVTVKIVEKIIILKDIWSPCDKIYLIFSTESNFFLFFFSFQLDPPPLFFIYFFFSE